MTVVKAHEVSLAVFNPLVANWPAKPSTLGIRLKRYTKELETVGITFSMRHVEGRSIYAFALNTLLYQSIEMPDLPPFVCRHTAIQAESQNGVVATRGALVACETAVAAGEQASPEPQSSAVPSLSLQESQESQRKPNLFRKDKEVYIKVADDHATLTTVAPGPRPDAARDSTVAPHEARPDAPPDAPDAPDARGDASPWEQAFALLPTCPNPDHT